MNAPHSTGPPQFLIGGALLFWGAQVGLLHVAAPMAAAVEAAHWVRAKWRFEDRDLNRIWDLCMALFLGAVLIRLASTSDAADASYQLFQWFPLIFFPLILGKAFSNRERFPTTVFSWVARRAKRVNPSRPAKTVDVGYAYLVVCVVSAGAGNRQSPLFFVGISILLFWGLWPHRSTRYRPSLWGLSTVAVVVLGILAAGGLSRLQRFTETRVAEWAASWMHRDPEANRTATALGKPGQIKLSRAIVLRIQLAAGEIPTRLRQGAYNRFGPASGSWEWFTSRDGLFRAAVAESDGTTWRIGSGAVARQALTIYASPGKGASLLPIPGGTTEIQDLPVGRLGTNRFGSVQIREAPGLVAYRTWHTPSAIAASPASPQDKDRGAINLQQALGQLGQRVTEEDLAPIAGERATMQQVLDGLHLAALDPNQKIAAIRAYFRDFTYSTYVPGNASGADPKASPIVRFLTKTRSGHCEYFATATVLLLRQAGIPARYVTGYMVHEKHPSGFYVVREKDGHAWAEAWVNDRWIEVDTTPGVSEQAEAQSVSILDQVRDWFSGVAFRFRKWRWLGEESWLDVAGPWLVVPLILALAWRIISRQRHKANERNSPPRNVIPGLDSEFYQIEQHLAARFSTRPPALPLTAWLKQIRLAGRPGLDADELEALVRLHYRLRFDPAGLRDEERQVLRQNVLRWLATASKPAASGHSITT